MAPRSRCHNRFRVSGPLADVRVLAVEQYGAGPWGTMQLADLGAEVIKVEDPSVGGDVGRYVPPYQEDESSLFFETFNRGKRSISLDLRNEALAACSRTRARRSDAVFSNLRGDQPDKLRLRFDDLEGGQPADRLLLALRLRHDRAARGEGAYDYTLQGLAGWQSVTGDPDGPPTKSGLSLVDFCGGYVAALAIVAGVWRARRDGRGADIDLSLFEVALAQLTTSAPGSPRAATADAARELGPPVDGPVPELRDRRRLARGRLPEAGALGEALLGARPRRTGRPRRPVRVVRATATETATTSSPSSSRLRVADDEPSGSRCCTPRACRARRSTTSRQRSTTRRRARASRSSSRSTTRCSVGCARSASPFRFDGARPAPRPGRTVARTPPRAARALRLLRRADRGARTATAPSATSQSTGGRRHDRRSGADGSSRTSQSATSTAAGSAEPSARQTTRGSRC